MTKATISTSSLFVKVYSNLQKAGSSTLNRFVAEYFSLYSSGIKSLAIGSPNEYFALSILSFDLLP